MVMEQLDSLYRDVILDHFRSPRNLGPLPEAEIKAEGTNPLCGDDITFWLKLRDGRVQQAAFLGKGCAISQATGSILTEQLQGKTLEEVTGLIETMKRLMQGQEPEASVELGDLEAMLGVRKFPVRVKCAALSWNVIEQGLKEYRAPSKEGSHGGDGRTSA